MPCCLFSAARAQLVPEKWSCCLFTESVFFLQTAEGLLSSFKVPFPELNVFMVQVNRLVGAGPYPGAGLFHFFWFSHMQLDACSAQLQSPKITDSYDTLILLQNELIPSQAADMDILFWRFLLVHIIYNSLHFLYLFKYDLRDVSRIAVNVAFRSVDILLCSFCWLSVLFSLLHLFFSILQSLCWRWLSWPPSAAPCSMATIWQSSTLLHRFVSLPSASSSWWSSSAFKNGCHTKYSPNEWKRLTALMWQRVTFRC